jgi:putative hydrolase of the HAD superfamily
MPANGGKTMPENTYKHIFFDLDHTLWDFERNSAETLDELFEQHQLARLGMRCSDFVDTYSHTNHELWALYNRGVISQEELRSTRFPIVFERLGLSRSQVPQGIGEDYLLRCPSKPYLLPYAKEVLDYLAPQYQLHIITNGFPETQQIKLQSSNITHYFAHVITSAEAQCKKPEPYIFTFLVEKLRTQAAQCLMIGDNLATDVQGAHNAGIDAVYFNPQKIPHKSEVRYEISCLSQLKEIL